MTRFFPFPKRALILLRVLAGWAGLSCGLWAASPYDGLVRQLSRQYENRAIRLAILPVTGKGPGSAAWSSALSTVETQLGEAVARVAGVILVDRSRLDLIEQENAFTGKVTSIEEVDTLIQGEVVLLGRQLSLNLRILEVSGGLVSNATVALEAAALGIDLEADLPPADALVKTMNATMFDIVRNLVKRDILLTTADPLFQKRAQVLTGEIGQWSRVVAGEVGELVKLDAEVVKRSLDDRLEYLITEGQVQGIDTARQQHLVEELRLLWRRAVDSGIEPDAGVIEKHCREAKNREVPEKGRPRGAGRSGSGGGGTARVADLRSLGALFTSREGASPTV